ncbi:MAG: undecaprenyl-diphosphate phosphatase [Rhodospirillales bacterium]|nr:undecaprenyl-diphosphate phosphatase [Rhodospirillales bacterium]
MALGVYGDAALLGLVEGLTEFLPVSSTGHLLLGDELLGFQGPPGRTFEVVIQLGAILAILWVYRAKLFGVALGLFSNAADRRFAANVTIAFIPALVLGATLHGFIKGVLFNPWVVSVALVAGGVAILWIERNLPRADTHEIDAMTPMTALKVGACQVVAMIPGVSRSGATIMGALLLGVDRKTATEFSFFLAIPTMLGATVYDLYKNRAVLGEGDYTLIAVGFAVAFFAALAVVRTLVGFVQRHGFVPFAWYRIAVGGVALAALAFAR